MALVTGKRHMLVQDIPAAVSSLGEACELLSAEFTDQLEGAQKASLTEASVEKKLCKTFLTLGEDSMENENYAQGRSE